jgi:hypothetical protein
MKTEKAIGWRFPENDAGEWHGFNDSGLEHFRGNPFTNLAREILQNSIDAEAASPVTIEFRQQSIDTGQIPNVQSLRAALEYCKIEAQHDQPRVKIFFDKAIKTLAAKQMSVLSISENNTTGISGPCENGTPYFAFMKATGQSKKAGDTGLGSFGIGKYAPFAVSNIRTVMISTVSKPAGKPNLVHYVQGKALLMSHHDGKKRTRQNVGYWGQTEGCLPADGSGSDVPSWLRRAKSTAKLKESQGTDIHVLGFDANEDWENLLIASVIESFFSAIYKSALVVRIGKKRIDKRTIAGFFEDGSVRESIVKAGEDPESFDNARYFLEATAKGEEVTEEGHENKDLGHCVLRMIVREGLPKRIAVLRNGMLITDQMDSLKRFGDFKDFVGVVECQTKKGNALLREMEPPRHNEFQPNRLSEEQRNTGRRALATLGSWVRDMLKLWALDPVSDVTDVSELAEYFGDDGEQTTSNAGEDVNPSGEIVIRARPLKSKIRHTSEDDDIDDDDDDDDDDDEPKPPKGKVTDLENVRSIIRGPNTRLIGFTPTLTGKIRIVLFEAGADVDRRLAIKKAAAGTVRQGNIEKFPVVKGKRVGLTVDLVEKFSGAMKVVGYEI